MGVEQDRAAKLEEVRAAIRTVFARTQNPAVQQKAVARELGWDGDSGERRVRRRHRGRDWRVFVAETLKDRPPDPTWRDRFEVLHIARIAMERFVAEQDLPPAEEILADWQRRGRPDPLEYALTLMQELGG